jgi:hypothetical protein
MTPNPEIVEKMKQVMLDTAPMGITHLVYSTPKGNIAQGSNHACHAEMASAAIKRSPVVGNLIPRYEEKIAQDFLEWLVSEDSVYYPIMKHVGDGYHVVRTDKGLVKGIIIDCVDVNNKLLTNFFKATRTVNEHSEALQFWEKWKIKQGKDPKICYVTSYFLDKSGRKISRSHSALETNWASNGKFNLDVVANPKNNKYWSVATDSRIDLTSYSGENNEAWGGGKFSFHKDIPVVTPGEKLKTRFVGIYEDLKKKDAGSYSDDSVSNFLDNYKIIAEKFKG